MWVGTRAKTAQGGGKAAAWTLGLEISQQNLSDSRLRSMRPEMCHLTPYRSRRLRRRCVTPSRRMEAGGAPGLALRPPQRTSSIFPSVAKAQVPPSSQNRLTWPRLRSPPPPTSSRAHLRAQARALHHAPRPPGRGSCAKWRPRLCEHASAASRPLPAFAPPS